MVSTRTLAVGTGIVILGAWLGASTLRAGAQAPERLGKVNFPTSCSPAVQAQFERAVALQHSFWFAESIKGFNAVAQADPSCGIAHWGAAVAFLGNPLAGPPVARGLQEGTAAVARAKAAGAKTQREQDYIAAIATFYTDADKVDHKTRAVAYEKAMEALAQKYPSDLEASIFYALALNTTLNPSDKTYANQLKAAGILEKVFAVQPEHPGVAHYLIHSYDFPPIAQKGLPAARRYASIAPSAPHAQHMPSHIFTRLGYWQDSINSNRVSAEVAKAELKQTNLEAGSYNALHAMDYITYAALQLGKDDEALALMRQAADREDATEKHPVTPGAIQPAREMLAELLLDTGQPTKALAEFEASHKTDPNRLHGLAGAARAAEASGDKTKAKLYYTRLIELTKTADSERPEITKAKAFVSSN